MEGLRGYAIYGLVVLPDGSPDRRAVVRITGARGLDQNIYTDQNGRYEFRDVAGGRYTLTVTDLDNPDLVASPISVDTSQAASNKIQFSFYLRPRIDGRTTTSTPTVTAKEAARQVPRQALRSFEQGQKLGSEGKLDLADSSFSKALELFPGYAEALAERGHIRVAAGRIGDATADFAQALKIDPQFGPALRGSGLCRFQEAKYAEAVEYLERAVAAEPTVAKGYLFLGLARMALDEREAARAAFERVLSLDPDGSARTHVHLANLAVKDNHPDEAVFHLETYLKAVPAAPDAPRVRAMLMELKKSR
jgi:tetratricopeptide (TPR) repeat protein